MDHRRTCQCVRRHGPDTRDPKGHLGRQLIPAVDGAEGGHDAVRGFYVLDGTGNGNGGQFHILRNDISDRIFQTHHPPS